MTEAAIWNSTDRRLEIPLPKEFSFAQNLAHLSTAPNECLYSIGPNVIRKAISAGSKIFVTEVTGSLDRRMMYAAFPGEAQPDTTEEREAVAGYIREWFDLSRDLAPFYELAARDPLLQGPIENYYGLRCMGIPDLFEGLCWGILGQQINLAYAYTLKRRLVEAYGRSADVNGIVYYVFPEPSVIAALTPEDMDGLGLSQKKREYLIGVARLFTDGELSKPMLLQLGDHASIEKKLVSIRGIGPWTANYVLMKSLRFPTAFPIDDVGLHNAVKHALGMDRKPTRQELLELSAAWSGWEAYATFYLWRLLY